MDTDRDLLLVAAATAATVACRRRAYSHIVGNVNQVLPTIARHLPSSCATRDNVTALVDDLPVPTVPSVAVRVEHVHLVRPHAQGQVLVRVRIIAVRTVWIRSVHIPCDLRTEDLCVDVHDHVGLAARTAAHAAAVNGHQGELRVTTTPRDQAIQRTSSNHGQLRRISHGPRQNLPVPTVPSVAV